MFDIGWTELLLIGLVALIVVGPKDLPGMFRALGKFTAKARRMARDFSRAMEEAADESGAKDAVSTLKNAANPRKMGMDVLNDAVDKFDKWEPGKTSSVKRAEMTPERQAFADKLAGKTPEADPEAEPERTIKAEAVVDDAPAAKPKPKPRSRAKAAPKPEAKAPAKPKPKSKAKPKSKPVELAEPEAPAPKAPKTPAQHAKDHGA